jgi:hypothetical protein
VCSLDTYVRVELLGKVEDEDKEEKDEVVGAVAGLVLEREVGDRELELVEVYSEGLGACIGKEVGGSS